jgi:Tfp pilus assembly protein PilX
MNAKRNIRRGLTSVMAMIYLTLLAALAVGFYSAIDVSTNLASNHQYINQTATAAESALAYARYQLAQLSIQGATSANIISKVYTQLTSNLHGAYTPALSADGSTIYIPGSGNSYTWMSTDNSGGQAYITITQPAGSNNYDLVVTAYGQNSNNAAHNATVGATPISRALQLTFSGNQGSNVTNPIFGYGLVSFGEIVINSNVTVSGTNGGVLAAVGTTGSPAHPVDPIQVNSTGSFSGDFYWSNNYAYNNITWGSLSVDGYLPTSGQFQNHVFGNVTGPTSSPLTFDTSSFATYVTPQTPTGSTTTLTNASLAAGSYTFNKPLTINGILYLKQGASVTFSSGVTVNGAIVQANGTTGGSIVFNSAVTQGSMPGSLPAGEQALTGTFLLAPSASVKFNAAANAVGSIVANGMSFNGAVTVNGGSIVNLGGMTFNNAANLTANTNIGTSPAGVNTVGGNVSYTPAASKYVEVGL